MGSAQPVGGAAKRRSIIKTAEASNTGTRQAREGSSDDEGNLPESIDGVRRLSRAPEVLSFFEDEAIAPPSAATAGADVLFAVRAVDQKVHTLRYNANSNKFSRWETADVVAYSGPTVGSSADCHFDLLVRTSSATLVHSACEGGVWTPWSEIPGACASTASACSVAQDTLEVFAADSAAGLLWRRQNVGRWTDWRKIPARLFSSPFAVAVSSNIHVFARSEQNTLLWLKSDGRGWKNWVDLGGVVTSAPRACTSGNYLHVFVRGGGTKCYSIVLDLQNESWSEWCCLGGVHASAVACAAVTGTAISAIFLMSANAAGSPQISRYCDGQWGGWKVVPGCTMF